MELTLVAAVQSEKKEMFVRDILTLPDAVQVDLMAIIEAGMSTFDDVDIPSLRDNESEIMKADVGDANGSMGRVKPNDQADSSSAPFKTHRPPLHVSRNAELERTKRENEVLKQDNVR